MRRFGFSDEIAYVAPMAIFLALVFVGATFPASYPYAYIARAILVAILLARFWPHYTKIRWTHLGLGVLVGLIGIVQWVGMQLWLQRHFALFKPDPDPFNPLTFFTTDAGRYGFIAVRIASAVLVVPIMEELFWRDYLWRMVLAPNDFKLARVGEWSWRPFLIVTGMFATVHGNWWLTAIVWAAMLGVLLLYTKSLGACIVAHATTNLLLAVYILKTHDWAFW